MTLRMEAPQNGVPPLTAPVSYMLEVILTVLVKGIIVMRHAN